MSTKIPLAWKNLTHEPRKLLLAMSGIAFAVILMFQQRGFRHALFDSTVAVIDAIDADLIVFNRSRFALTSEVRFQRELLDIAASQPGVKTALPLYMENQFARFRTAGRRARPIRVIAFDFDQPMLLDRQGVVIPEFGNLRAPATALMDRFSKESYGIELTGQEGQIQEAELNGKHLSIIGFFQMGRDFAHEGNLYMSTDNFVNYFPFRAADPLKKVDLGAIRIDPDVAAQQMVDSLQEKLGESVIVLTKQQYMQKEKDFWAKNTPIGVIFAIGAVMGFVVGIIICYQVLANDISEHLGEFATLKAMGYGNSFFFGLVIQQAVLLSLLGFLPGLCCSWLLFQLNSSFTGLLMNLSWDRALFVLGLTMIMCVISGFLALRKLLAADPASLF
jgi:putative ABC transport system permease protein